MCHNFCYANYKLKQIVKTSGGDTIIDQHRVGVLDISCSNVTEQDIDNYFEQEPNEDEVGYQECAKLHSCEFFTGLDASVEGKQYCFVSRVHEVNTDKYIYPYELKTLELASRGSHNPELAMSYFIDLNGEDLPCGGTWIGIDTEYSVMDKDNLEMVLKELFSLDRQSYTATLYYNPLYSMHLQIEEISRDGNFTKIKLSGQTDKLTTCDRPRVYAVIAETIKQFTEEEDFEVTINDVPLSEYKKLILRK